MYYYYEISTTLGLYGKRKTYRGEQLLCFMVTMFIGMLGMQAMFDNI